MSRPNVLLVVLDSVRAKNAGLYGHHRETTPFLSAYADGATHPVEYGPELLRPDLSTDERSVSGP